MQNKEIIRNIFIEILVHMVLICRLCNMENTILNNACKFLPLLFSFSLIIVLTTLIILVIASIEPKFKAKLFNDKSLIETTSIKIISNKKIKIYQKVTNCTLSILLILNGFIGLLSIHLLFLFFSTWSKFVFEELIKQNTTSAQVHKEYINILAEEQPLN